MNSVVVIGSGFSGLSAAAFLAKAGCEVTVVEKNDQAGGRAGKFDAGGFVFDMGPSWYWMPDVFEKFFAAFGKKTTDYYQLKRLDPSYTVFWSDEVTQIPARYNELQLLFEKYEEGSSARLDTFLEEARYKYEVAMNKLVYKPGHSVTEFFDWDFAKGLARLDVFNSMRSHIRKYFKHPRLMQLLEFPVLFLGAMPADIPALYSLMNYADMKLGTWYPMGGMYKVVEAMVEVARENGVKFLFNADAKQFNTDKNKVNSITLETGGKSFLMKADAFIAAADYHHMENLLPVPLRNYSESYWETRVMAPSCLLYFVGLNKKLKVSHHSLFFDVDFEKHGREIYTEEAWPEDPLFYVCAPSVTDDSVAPSGCENLFFLIPVAAGLKGDSDELRQEYFNKIIQRFEKLTDQEIKSSIIFMRSYSVSDFVADHNAFKGNAYGLANTLRQTAFMKPSIRNRKLKNLFYAGQLTVPGPGVPPSIISGELTAGELLKSFEKRKLKIYDQALS